MNKKIIIVSVILVILIVCVGFFIYSNNTVKVDNTYFSIPEGYSAFDNDGYFNITNGKEYMCIIKNVSHDDLNKSMNSYIKTKKSNENTTVSISNFSVNNYTIYKSVSNSNGHVYHYWFADDSKIYEFFTWSGDSNSDYIVSKLVMSMKWSILL